MITCVIIDDELHGRIALKEKMNIFCPEVTVLAEAENGEAGIEIIKRYNPDLVFLDVEMPVMNGFEMLNKLMGIHCKIVFTTAYDQYAIKAIKHAAFDYLLKPIDIEDLRSVVKKAVETGKNDTAKQSSPAGKSFTKIAVATLEGLVFIPIQDIIYLQAESNYTTFYLLNNIKVVSSKSLGEYEEILSTQSFFRCHHSYMINLDFVSKYIKTEGGQIVMTNGAYVDLSRRKRNEFLEITGYNKAK